MNQAENPWRQIVREAEEAVGQEPQMADFFHRAILAHGALAPAVSFILSEKVADSGIPAARLREVIDLALGSDPDILKNLQRDLFAYYQRDPACDRLLMPLLFFKGFQAIQLHRIAHWLWLSQRRLLALDFQSRVSCVFAVDIHPAATLGGGIMLDHATGLVVGETASIGDNTSILHSVTLGGSGCASGDRHPKIGEGVLIAAGAKILGNITIGDGVKVGAGSLLLESVPAHVTVAGVPAKIVGRPREESPALEMDQSIDSSQDGVGR